MGHGDKRTAMTGSTFSDVTLTASEIHRVSKAPDGAPRPNVQLNFVALEEGDAGVLFIKVTDRAATQLKVQGRHISAHELMLQAVYARCEGKSIPESIKALIAMLSEYIGDDESLEKFNKEVDTVYRTVAPFIKERDRRIRLGMALRAAQRTFEDHAVNKCIQAAVDADSEAREGVFFKDQRDVLAVTEEDIVDMRNAMKRSDELAPLTQVLNVVIASLVKLLNKMDDVAFEGKKTKPAKDEGARISRALEVLRRTPKLEKGKN